MKTTIELPDELLREAKARAAREGRSLKEYFTRAVQDRLDAEDGPAPEGEAWRAVFGRARPADLQEADEIVAAEFERVDRETWL